MHHSAKVLSSPPGNSLSGEWRGLRPCWCDTWRTTQSELRFKRVGRAQSLNKQIIKSIIINQQTCRDAKPAANIPNLIMFALELYIQNIGQYTPPPLPSCVQPWKNVLGIRTSALEGLQNTQTSRFSYPSLLVCGCVFDLEKDMLKKHSYTQAKVHLLDCINRSVSRTDMNNMHIQEWHS